MKANSEELCEMVASTLQDTRRSATSHRKVLNSNETVPIRKTALPEYATYRDTGCELAAACLECPLALCKYDDPNWGKRKRKVGRDMEIVRLRSNGEKVSQIAKIVNTSERTVYRVIQRDYYPKLAMTEAA